MIGEFDSHNDPIRGEGILLLFNAHHEPVKFKLPQPAAEAVWTPLLDTNHLAKADEGMTPASNIPSGSALAVLA